MNRLYAIVLAMLLPAGILPGLLMVFVAANTASAGPNCTCRHSGGDVLEGQTACIKGPNGMTMARCERVLNNTSWKMLDAPCPFAGGYELGPPMALPGDHPVTASELPAPIPVLRTLLNG